MVVQSRHVLVTSHAIDRWRLRVSPHGTRESIERSFQRAERIEPEERPLSLPDSIRQSPMATFYDPVQSVWLLVRDNPERSVLVTVFRHLRGGL